MLKQTKLLHNIHPGMSRLDYSCNCRNIGESNENILIRCTEDQQRQRKR